MANFIEINKEEEKLVWLVASKVKYNTDLTVVEGCQAIVLCDGAIIDNLYPGQHKINIKSLLSKADGKIWSVYGVNTSDLFELLWGCQTKYKDQEFDIVVTLKMSGEVITKIENGGKLFRAIELKDGAITKDMLQEQFRKKLIDDVQNSVVQITREMTADYLITDIKAEIGNKLREALKKNLRERYGLDIVDVFIRINSYEELEAIWELKRKAAASSIQKDIHESAGAGIKAIAEGLSAIATQNETEKKEDKNSKIELIINRRK